MPARPIVARRRSFINFIRLPAFFRTSVWSRRRSPMFAFAATWPASCMAGRNVARKLEALSSEIGGKQVVVGGVSCLGQCDRPPAVDDQRSDLSRQDVSTSFASLSNWRRAANGCRRNRPIAGRSGWKIDPYEGQPRYECVRKFVEAWQADRDADLRSKRARISDPILKTFETAKLRGMGGAGFPTFRKWTTVRDCRGDAKYHDLQRRRKRAGHVQGSRTAAPSAAPGHRRDHAGRACHRGRRGWIFIRHEYQEEIAAVREALAAARAIGASGPRIFGSELSHELEVFVSPGGYICGEETALLEAMEDRRAEPRNKPPLLVFEGFQGKPTVVNNVETYSWVPSILLRGGEWYRDQGTHGCSGLRFVSISGDVAEAGRLRSAVRSNGARIDFRDRRGAWQAGSN